MANLYSEEQKQRAKNIDLEQYLTSHGERLKRVGGESVWVYRDASGTHDSVTVRGNKWYDHKRQQGGDSIGFLQEFMGYSFPSAVETLLNGEQGKIKPNSKNLNSKRDSVEEKKTQQNPFFYTKTSGIEKSSFQLPEAADNMRKLFAYLVKTRHIATDIVQHFVSDKSIYQDKFRGNIVFVGRNTYEEAVSGSAKSTNTYIKNSYKGTLTGSNTAYGFGHKGKSNLLYIFEAPIDLLSYLTIYPENWQEHSYQSLDGLSPKAMIKFLEEHSNVNEVYICIDNDEAGIEATDKFRDLLMEKGFSEYKIHRTTPVYKDWNEMLKAEAGQNYKPAQPHQRMEALKQIIEDLCDTASRGSRYKLWHNQQYKENGLSSIGIALQNEYEMFQKCIDIGKNAKLTSPKAKEHLMRIADICFHSIAEIRAENNPNSNQIKNYRESTSSIDATYKPYLDKGKLRNRCVELDKSYKTLKNSLFKKDDKDSVADNLLELAKHCLLAKVYLDTKYEADLHLQESLAQNQSHQPEPSTIDNFQDDNPFVLSM